MKKILISLTALLFLAGAGCSSVSNQPAPTAFPQQTNTKGSDQRPNDNVQQNTSTEQANQTQPSAGALNSYLVMEKYIYVSGHPQDESFSFYTTDGQLIKTLSAPSDMIKGIVGNRLAAGDSIFYLGGTTLDTSIKKMSTTDGSITALDFTRSQNTNVGNVLSAIPTWAVSNDGQHVAWVDTTGKIRVADSDGSHLLTLMTKETNPDFIWLQFSPDANSLYYWDGESENLMKWNLVNNTQTMVMAKVSLNRDFTLSPSGKYLVYYSDKGDAIIKNLLTGSQVTIPLDKNYDLFEGVSFSPDERKIVLGETVMGMDGSGQPNVMMVADVDSGKTSAIGKNLSPLDFISNSLILVQDGVTGANASIQTNGQNLKKISNDQYYVGSVADE